jgi:hypothetical protein
MIIIDFDIVITHDSLYAEYGHLIFDQPPHFVPLRELVSLA